MNTSPKTVQEIKADLMAKMRRFYRAPSHIDGDQDAAAYLAELGAQFARMQPTEGEWDHVWPEFARQWEKAFWPTLSEFPRRLAAFRAKTATLARAGDRVNRRAERGPPSPPYHHGRFMAACDEASFQASSPDPGERYWGRLLLNLGRKLIETRDDDDRARDPKRRAFEEGIA